ncbi:MAG: hypothetical protein R2719_12910 [Micropruina sp.]
MSRIHDLLDELGITIDPQLFELALIHRSYAYENGRSRTTSVSSSSVTRCWAS